MINKVKLVLLRIIYFLYSNSLKCEYADKIDSSIEFLKCYEHRECYYDENWYWSVLVDYSASRLRKEENINWPKRIFINGRLLKFQIGFNCLTNQIN